MRIKKYIAKSMREALLQIKDDLGEDAIILKSRKLPKGVFALGSNQEIEVTAALDDSNTSKSQEQVKPIAVKDTGVYARPKSSTVIEPQLAESGKMDIRPWYPPGTRTDTKKIPIVKETGIPGDAQLVELKEDIQELRKIVTSIVPQAVGSMQIPVSGNSHILFKKLEYSEVKRSLNDKLCACVTNPNIFPDSQLDKKFFDTLQHMFPVSGPLKLKNDRPTVVAFIGPTGAGKTTTLAKLASHCTINKHKRVSIITADTYRIAAIEQIKMFADIVKVSLHVVFSPDEIPQALDEARNSDVIFVDTAGRSQKNQEHMQELHQFLHELRPDETHLVLSAQTKESDLLDIVDRYRSLRVNRLLFTKLDETSRLGPVLNIVEACSLPVSYFTFGQSVPDDIELAQPAKFFNRLWEAVVL